MQLISAFVFATYNVDSAILLHPKSQASSYPLWLYSPVCVANPEDKFSDDEAQIYFVCNDRKMFVISANDMCATEFIETYDFIARYSCLINLAFQRGFYRVPNCCIHGNLV